jgi:hypothetical protein
VLCPYLGGPFCTFLLMIFIIHVCYVTILSVPFSIHIRMYVGRYVQGSWHNFLFVLNKNFFYTISLNKKRVLKMPIRGPLILEIYMNSFLALGHLGYIL